MLVLRGRLDYFYPNELQSDTGLLRFHAPVLQRFVRHEKSSELMSRIYLHSYSRMYLTLENIDFGGH